MAYFVLMDPQELFSGHGWRVTLEEAPLPDGRVKTSAHVHRAD
ncbi:MAG: hypothetical protein Greene041619_1038, partial [Candidatus Peregrinibacteria bacterium Greene0416_19]